MTFFKKVKDKVMTETVEKVKAEIDEKDVESLLETLELQEELLQKAISEAERNSRTEKVKDLQKLEEELQNEKFKLEGRAESDKAEVDRNLQAELEKLKASHSRKVGEIEGKYIRLEGEIEIKKQKLEGVKVLVKKLKG